MSAGPEILILPSKKLLYIVSIFLLVGAGVFGFIRRDKSPREEEGTLLSGDVLTTVDSLVAQIATEDTDGDGLKDWEESLWGTKIDQVDSDGDGFSDKEEVDGGYDPVDALSNPTTEKKKEVVLQPNGVEQFKPDPDNLTQSIAYTLGVQVGTNPDYDIETASPLSLVDKGTSKMLAEYMAGFDVEISETELSISSDNSKEAVQRYVSDIIQRIPKDPYPEKSASDIFDEAIKTKDFKVINEYIAHYQKAVEILKEIVVPSVFAQNHKKQIELTLSTKKSFESVKEIENDALKTILGLEKYQKTQEELRIVVEEFSVLISEYK